LHADGEPSTVVDLPDAGIELPDYLQRGDPNAGLNEGDRNAGLPGDGYAVVLGSGHRGIDSAAADPGDVATVSLVSALPDAAPLRAAARAAAALAGVTLLRSVDRPHALAFLVPAAEGRSLARAIHSAVALVAYRGEPSLRSEPSRRIALGHT
jgi:hypothetical protein